jgi:hypothetical protein
MKRHVFLTIAALVALIVATLALLWPAHLLHSKGVAPSAAAEVWIREVSVLLIALAALVLMVRRHDDSPTLRAVLVFNMLVQLGLFPIEIAAWFDGVITRAWGVIPNSVLHLVLAACFGYYACSPRQAASA